MALEHATLYARLKPYGDAGVLAKFCLGVLAILAGCWVIRWWNPNADPLITPLVCSAGGLVIASAYGVRWLWGRAMGSAYMRGRLAGLADRADIAEDGDGR